jgi:hypothetical protein
LRGKYTGGAAACLAAAAALALARLGTAEAAPPEGAGWQPAPAFVALFTPAFPPGAYEAYVTAAPLEAVLRRLDSDPAILRPPGAWRVTPAAAREAFAGHGTHNPWQLARLYGGRAASVARGPRGEGSRPSESWTLISPYPDATLSKLEPGTLLLVVRLP